MRLGAGPHLRWLDGAFSGLILWRPKVGTDPPKCLLNPPIADRSDGCCGANMAYLFARILRRRRPPRGPGSGIGSSGRLSRPSCRTRR
jgi:hypothetical protein